MRAAFRSLACLLLTAAACVMPGLTRAQSFSANYDLTRAAPLASVESELLHTGRGFSFGSVRLAPAFGTTMGAGLSLEAGEAWFGRLALGRNFDADLLSLGGGYRFGGGQSISMQLTRASQDRLGLSVRYDWPRYYLRLGVDREGAMPDTLRFSAGMRF